MIDPAKLPTITQIQAEKCRYSLADFIHYGWHVLEPDTPLVPSWHIGALADHMQALFLNWIKRGDDDASEQHIIKCLINIPLGTAKSCSFRQPGRPQDSGRVGDVHATCFQELQNVPVERFRVVPHPHVPRALDDL